MRALEPGFLLRTADYLQTTADRITTALPSSDSIITPLGKKLLLRTRDIDDVVFDRWQAYVQRLCMELISCFPKSEQTVGIIPISRGKAKVFGTETILRLDQLVSGRLWGVTYSGPRPFLDALEKHAFEQLVSKVGANARAAAKIFERNEKYQPEWLPGINVDPLEHMLIDILNEVEPCARRATLEEDFIEKTDIRVNFPELERRQGARIQVTRTYHKAQLQQKTKSIELSNEIILLSPLTLAQARRVRDTEYHARQIYEEWTTALQDSQLAPIGPANAVDEDLREEIRDFVRSQAMTCTEEMRKREQKFGAKPSWIAAAIARQTRDGLSIAERVPDSGATPGESGDHLDA